MGKVKVFADSFWHEFVDEFCDMFQIDAEDKPFYKFALTGDAIHDTPFPAQGCQKVMRMTMLNVFKQSAKLHALAAVQSVRSMRTWVQPAFRPKAKATAKRGKDGAAEDGDAEPPAKRMCRKKAK